jgi:hypothetical protein
MQKWHYKMITIRDLALSESKLNVEGERGWELVSLTSHDGHTARAFFKIAYEGEVPPLAEAHPAEAIVHH